MQAADEIECGGGEPVIAVNLGRTRADHLRAAKVEQDCDVFLAAWCAAAMPEVGAGGTAI